MHDACLSMESIARRLCILYYPAKCYIIPLHFWSSWWPFFKPVAESKMMSLSYPGRKVNFTFCHGLQKKVIRFFQQDGNFIFSFSILQNWNFRVPPQNSKVSQIENSYWVLKKEAKCTYPLWNRFFVTSQVLDFHFIDLRSQKRSSIEGNQENTCTREYTALVRVKNGLLEPVLMLIS